MLLTKKLSNDREIQYQCPWDGKRLKTPPRSSTIALDTETEPIKGVEIPKLALVSVSSGEEHALLYPDQAKSFLEAHWDCHYVSHNTAFDFWAVSPHGCLELAQELVDDNRWHDTMLLDLLIRLAKGVESEDKFYARNLDELAREYVGLSVPKDDPYRLRYGEIIGQDFGTIDRGFLDYGIQDAVVDWLVWQEMEKEALRLQAPMVPSSEATRFEMYPDAIRRFGLLTEGVQVKAAISLVQSSRNGIAIDDAAISSLEAGLREELGKQVAWLGANYPQLLSYYKTKKLAGQLKVNKGTLVPHFRTGEMRPILEQIATERKLKVPRTPKDNKVSASVASWRVAAPDHPLIASWSSMQDVGKMIQFVAQVKGRQEIHPEYRTIVRTGRTSSYKGSLPGGLNVQQMPREGDFRRIFVARPHSKLVAIDYSYIELRTLASVCMARYGKSRLADVIREGVDPHVVTAAQFRGMEVEEFKALKKRDPEGFKASRQAAKAVNFGVPGGLGAQRLAAYAKANYGVDMDPKTALAMKTTLINEVYPEIGVYLQDNGVEDLAANLLTPVGRVRAVLGICEPDEGIRVHSVRKIVGGRAYKMDGTPYNQRYVAEVWIGLETLNNSGDLKIDDAISRQEGSAELERLLFRRTVPTLTGRLRAGVTYTEARNTPFQGLAADGAKLALWELTKAGFKVVAFVHDEILLEIPTRGAFLDIPGVGRIDNPPVSYIADKAEEVMCQAMEQVLHPYVPCACESAVGDHWTKA